MLLFMMIKRVEDIDFDKILLGEKSYEDLQVYNISYETFTFAKPLHVRFNKIDGFIKYYDGIRQLVLFDPERYNATYDRVNYVEYIINHNFAKIRIDSYKFTYRKNTNFLCYIY